LFFSAVFFFGLFISLLVFPLSKFSPFPSNKNQKKQNKFPRTRYCLKTLKRFKYFRHSGSLVKTRVDGLKKEFL
jgi:hypothetical protein